MNNKHPDQHDGQTDETHDETRAPLPEPDGFEQRWMSLLDPAEPDQADDAPSRDTEAFVAGVMDRYDAMQRNTGTKRDQAVAGRIGRAALPYAAAAAVLLAALIGGYALITDNTSGPDPANHLATPGPTPPDGEDDPENQTPPQPAPGPQVTHHEPPRVELGRLITQTQALATRPDPDLIKTLNQTRQTLDLNNLLEVVNRPLPDLQQLLAPLKQDDQQSRA